MLTALAPHVVVVQDFAKEDAEPTVETKPQDTEAATAPTNDTSSHQYECANCKKTKSGTRYLVLPAYDCTFLLLSRIVGPDSSRLTRTNFVSVYIALQYCPECTDILTTPEDNKPLPRALRQLLKGTLPLPDDDETTTVAGDDEEESDQDKVAKQLTAVDERLDKLEGKFSGIDDRMQSLESKLDQILSLLAAVHTNPPASE